MKRRWVLTPLVATLLAVCVVSAQPDPQDDPRTAATEDYVIGIEDELRIFVWGEADLTQRVKVRPDGKVTVPLVNDVVVAGLTTNQVRNKISQALATYIREPHVTVIVESIQSYRVYFLGEIQRQGALNFYRPTRLLQGIAAAGGLTQYSKKEVVLLREVRGEEKRIPVDYKRLLSGVDTEQNVYLLAGDTVLVR